MKTLLSLLLVAAGAGFAFHDQLQTWLRPPPPAKEEIYYLRAAHQTTNPNGTVVRWAPGQPLRTTTRAVAAAGAVALTDGTNVLQVPMNALTRDANEAATLRQTDLISENTARMQAAQQNREEFLAGSQSSSTYQPGGVSTTGAQVYYYPVYVAPAATPVPTLRNLSAGRSQVTVLATPPPRHHDSHPRPSPTPSR